MAKAILLVLKYGWIVFLFPSVIQAASEAWHDLFKVRCLKSFVEWLCNKSGK